MTPNILGGHHEHLAGFGRNIVGDAPEYAALYDGAIVFVWRPDFERRHI